MKNNLIDVQNLTKDYGNGRGVFDVSIQVARGECYGFLGPNGAGKTTTIRHMMGFSKPDSGIVSIAGKDCWQNAATLKHKIGYIPGEISLPTNLTGEEFLNMNMKMHHIDEAPYCTQLINRFEMKTNKKTREMSLGEKRKLAIISAFMHNPEILILDEPTSGLDPVMQQEFISFIEEEKLKGKTIFLSSHIFSEVDAACDRIAIIKSGEIVSEFSARDISAIQDDVYTVSFASGESYECFKEKNYKLISDSSERLKVKVKIPSEMLNDFVRDMSMQDIKEFHHVKFSLEDYFMQFYKSEEVRK